jgi:UDP-GlcNAc:undecaprenyl-phosphate GlcNAc-1-phosphate transferase
MSIVQDVIENRFEKMTGADSIKTEKVRILPLTAFALCLFFLLPDVRGYMWDMGWRWAYVLGFSFLFCFSLTPVCGWMARRLDILDKPDARKAHRQATPLLGGMAVFIAFASGLIINGIFNPKIVTLMIASGILFSVGTADDAKKVSAGLKLMVQMGAAALVMWSGIILQVVPDRFGMLSSVCNIVLTGLWMVGLTNAMNFFDGMDGLAAGLGAIISFFLGIVAFHTEQPFLGWMAAAMMGSCMGFLPYNFRINGDAEIFMGDAGSTVIGFVLACLAVYGEWSEISPVAALASPLLIFWILIFDMVHITVDRILSGKVRNFREWIEYVGKDHLHHRLADVLGGKKKSVLFIYLLAFCMGTSAVVLRDANLLNAFLLLAQAGGVVILITILERRGRSLARECGPEDTGGER